MDTIVQTARRTLVQAGACVPSKLNTTLAIVPTIPATVTAVPAAPPLLYETDEHATVVADVHDVLLHATDTPSDAVALGSIELKFKPEIVTKPPPVCGTL
jgi:hypothetical protein